MSEQTSSSATARSAKKPHGSLLANLAFNLIIPTLILTKLGKEDYLGPSWAIVVALAFPIGYGLRDFVKTREANVFSILGVISIALTGGISLMQLDPKYIAIKEAAIPGLIGLATLISQYTPYPLVKTFLFNDQIMQVDRITDAARERGTLPLLEQRLKVATYLVASSFFLSSVLNYLLAKWVLVSPPGTTAYTEELGKMTALSFPVIAIPSMVVMTISLVYLFVGIEKLTQLKLEDILQQH
ncbi:VC0807 family protein [Litorivivens sp.]|uniref:VC0807 family protein n=1 Tax=Litorivivens sp. TaxID=2020868 RepID=UPI0035685802